MFVQLNPDVNSYSESLSTLKFAERVSGVELGAARSNKEGRDVRELMEQVASLKSTIAKKDEEIEQLQLRKGLKSVHTGSNGEKRGTAMRYASSSPRRETVGGTTPPSQKPLGGKGLAVKSASDLDFYSEQSDKHSEDDFQNSMDDFKYQNELVRQSKVAGDTEIIGLGDADYDERSSDISDGGLSMGTDTDGSVESTFTSETTKRSDIPEKPKLKKLPPKVSRAPLKPGRTASPTTSKSKPSPKMSPKLLTFSTNVPFRF
jgi:kinesin family protein C2/C3